jgi:hypothetical protein
MKKATSMRIWFIRLLALGSTVAVLVALPPGAAAAGRSSLGDVRNATASFHDVSTAERAGYGRLLPCFDRPGVGGMGQHYVNTSLFDAQVNVSQPEALVYEVDGDRLQLVAVEYIIPFTSWSSEATPPTLLGQSFIKNTTLGLWTLHAWIWRPNPLGMFVSYNPSVKLCPGS